MRHIFLFSALLTGLSTSWSYPGLSSTTLIGSQVASAQLAETQLLTSAAHQGSAAQVTSNALEANLAIPMVGHFLTLLLDHASLLSGLGLMLTGGAISWGVFQYAQQQNWQRIEALRQAVKAFEDDPHTHKALKILDFEEYRDYRIDSPVPGTSFSFRLNDEILCNALAPHNTRAHDKYQLDFQADHDTLNPDDLRQYQIETAVRDWFNTLLNGLEHFGYFIESGLCTTEELRPWLNYWIKLIGDPTFRRPGASRFYDALYSYIHHSGFFGVQKLFERFGYRILPSPYRDDDWVDLNLSGQYDTQMALTLAKAAYLAYQDKQFVAEVVNRWGSTLYARLNGHEVYSQTPQPQGHNPPKNTQRPAHLSKHSFIRYNFRYFNNRGRDTQAYIFRTPEYMVLAFRGSQEPKDWLTNVATQLRNFTIRKDGEISSTDYRGRVHTGFFLSWSIIEKSVLSQIDRWQKEAIAAEKPPLPIYITGHSLGGALATMAAAALSAHGITVAGVYTFGQPRVGDRTFARQLHQLTAGKLYRFVNDNDIVPHVPPPFSIWNPTRLYGHLGTAKYFDGAGILTNRTRFPYRLLNRSLGILKGIFGSGFDLISDHKMEYYISHLTETLKEELEDHVSGTIQPSVVDVEKKS